MYPRFKGTKIFGLLSFRPKILLDLSSFYLKCFTNNFFLTQFLFNKKFVVPKTYWSHLFFIYRASPQKKGDQWVLQFMLYCSFDMEPRIFIFNSMDNWNPYVRCKYKTIYERYQGAKKYIFSSRICVFKTLNCTVVNHQVCIFWLFVYIFRNSLHF